MQGGSRTLYLVFPRASANQQDVSILGTLSDTCNSVTFRAATSIAFQSIQPGVYAIQVTSGRPQAPLTFIGAASKSGASGGDTAAAKSGAVRSRVEVMEGRVGGQACPKSYCSDHTTTCRQPDLHNSRSLQALVTVVDAAVGQLAGDVNVAATSSSLAVTLTAQLAAPALLPATMSLQLSDPSAAAVSPPALTWRAGEMGPKHFTLQLRRPVAAEGAAQGILAEAVAVGNMVFGNGQSRSLPPRVSVYVPPPTFYVPVNTAIYRDGPPPVRRPRQGAAGAAGNGTAAAGNSSATGSNSGASAGNAAVSDAATGSGGSSQRAGSSADNTTVVMVPVRRASASPFPSTLAFKVQLLESVGCASRVRCAAAVRGGGQLRFTGDQDVVGAPVWVDYSVVPQEAVLRVAVILSAVDNARVLSYSDMLLLQWQQQQQQQDQSQQMPGWVGTRDDPVFVDADNVTSLFVFGTTYGMCPAGTAGPWQEPQLAPQESAGPAAGPTSGPGAGTDITNSDSSQQVIPPPRDRVCDGEL